MGVDWVRMRPRADVDLAELARMVAEEAASWQAFSCSHPPIGVANDGTAADRRTIRSGATWDDIRDRLDCLGYFDPDVAHNEEFRGSWSVSVIDMNRDFPPSVRRSANRTILPDELPGQLARWREWIDAAWTGHYEGYRLDLFVAEAALDLRERWWHLRRVAESTLGNAAAWANRPGFLDARDRVLALPEPTVPPMPLTPIPGPAAPDDHAGLATLRRETEALRAANRAWNYEAKTSKRQHYDRDEPEFHPYPATAQPGWETRFFAWADRCCAEGLGWLRY